MGHIVKLQEKKKHIHFIESNLGKISQREIAKKLGIGKTTVNRWSAELGYHPTKHTFDESFFDKMSEKSAYVLGLIFADGNVSWSPEKSYWTLTITAAEKDVNHLEKIRELLKSTKPLLYSPKTKSYRLTITNKALCQKLIGLGVIPRKSLTVKFPKLPKQYLKDFIRGVIDGDGNVRYVDRKRSPYFEITIASGSKEFCGGLVDAVKENFEINTNIRKTGNNVYIAQYSCGRGKKLAEAIYSGATIFLERKHDAFVKSKIKGGNKND